MSSSSVALTSVATETAVASSTSEEAAAAVEDSQLVVVSSRSGRRSRGFFSRGDSSALERFSAAVASAAASVSNTFTHPATAPSAQRTSCSNADCSDLTQEEENQLNLDEDDLAVAAAAVEEVANPSSSLTASLTELDCNAMQLRVPSSGYGGAIPRRPFSRDSSAESNSSSCTGDNTTKTCFCGHYTEVLIVTLIC